jgi:hypothetical protein
MAHYAKIVDGIVVDVRVAERDYIDDQEGAWIQTSYNTWGGVHYGYELQEFTFYDEEENEHTETVLQPVPDGGIALRKNYAGIGMSYDADRDAFYAPQPYPSWTLNEDTCYWEAPTAKPDDNHYTWDEDAGEWVAVE